MIGKTASDFFQRLENMTEQQHKTESAEETQQFAAKFAKDLKPINDFNLKQYSKAYLNHLFKTNEPLGMRFATLNNLGFYLKLMSEIRNYIKSNKL